MLLEIPGATIESHPCTLSNLPGKLRSISQLLEFRSLEQKENESDLQNLLR